ncbi:MAG: GGDEF domain-containing protein [Clostridiales bacterium]|nr:GGDEF domain-containing protein [Clostridiales bacterium]
MDSVENPANAHSAEVSLFSRTMRFLVQNVYAFTVGVMCLVHAVLIVIMLVSRVWPLFYFNIGSVVIYALCFVLSREGKILPVYFSVIMEVTLYSVISTYYIGLQCGTFCFLVSIVPIIIYFGCQLYKGKQRGGVVMMLLLNFAIFVALFIRFDDVEPVFVVAPAARMILMIFSAFAMVFSIIFYNAMYIFSSESAVVNLEQKNKQLSTDAHEDALTSLLNRRGFLPLVQARMSDRKKRFCIAFCDLDDFKHVNDSYGHDGGDEVLKNVTGLIIRELPGCDICRWGGEEIVILLNDYDLAAAREKMENVRKIIESTPTVFYGKQICVTVTIGLEEYKESYSDPEAVIKVADERMYYGKQHGKNVLIYSDN